MWVGVFQNILVIDRRTDTGYDAFATLAIIVASPAPPTSRSMFALTVTRAFTFSSMPFFGDSGNKRGFNNFRINAHLHSFKHVPAGKVDRGRPLERQNDLSPVRRYQGIDNLVNVAACQKVRFKLVYVDIKPRFVGFYQRQYDFRRAALFSASCR